MGRHALLLCGAIAAEARQVRRHEATNARLRDRPTMSPTANPALNMGAFSTQVNSWTFQASKDPLALVTETPMGWPAKFDARLVGLRLDQE